MNTPIEKVTIGWFFDSSPRSSSENIFYQRPLNALYCAKGTTAYQVEIYGDIENHSDGRISATHYRIIKQYDAADILEKFARYCAREASHLWSIPDSVHRSLMNYPDHNIDLARMELSTLSGFAAWSASHALQGPIPKNADSASVFSAKAQAWADNSGKRWLETYNSIRSSHNRVLNELLDNS